MLAIVIGVCFYFFKNSQNNSKKILFIVFGVIFLGFGFCTYFIYQYQYAHWTSAYDGRGVVTIGKTMLPDAERYAREHPEMGTQMLIQVYAGQIEQIWYKSEIIFRHLLMLLTFFASVISLSLAILLVTFAGIRDEQTRID
ncbi:hypothetical protein AXW83_03320 [Bosea sp. PAMC 26642]|nr:hypothetical protein AXW83_03320 [Bosea sp. PAMC 26642]